MRRSPLKSKPLPKKLEELNLKASKIESVEDLSKKLSKLEESLTNLNKSLSKISEKVSSLEDEVERISDDIQWIHLSVERRILKRHKNVYGWMKTASARSCISIRELKD